MTSEKKTTKSRPTDEETGTSLALPSSSGLASILDEFMRPFDQFMQPFFPRSIQSLFPGLASFGQQSLDVQDRGDHFSVTAELPGFTKDDVEVKVGPDSIELKADRSQKQTKEEKGEYRTSRSSYHQYVSLPERVNAEKVDGTMKNGILELRIPKAAPRRDDKTRRVDLK